MRGFTVCHLRMQFRTSFCQISSNIKPHLLRRGAKYFQLGAVALKCGHVLDQWKTVVDNRHEGRMLIRTVCESHDIKRMKEDESRRERRQKKSSHKTVLCNIHYFGVL